MSDLQVPYHNKSAVTKLIGFTRWWKPDRIACVGDELDAPMLSTYEQGQAGEYSGRLMKDIRIMRELLSEFRKAAPKADFIVQRSNHTDRLEKYIAKRAPALTSLPGLKYEALIGFEALGITYAKKLSEIAPSVLMGHGDEGNLSGVSGMTGLKLAQVTQKSVVIGHTHRLGLVYESVGHSGQVSSKFAMEVGNLMDLSQAHYLRPRGAANWQQGFGVLWVSGKRVQPQVVKMTRDGSFIFDGKEF